jgi:tRNA(Arg) A34 adenosine deaminase TadA
LISPGKGEDGDMDLDEAQTDHLRTAIGVARNARVNGNHPFGAILVDASGTQLLAAENSVVTSRDATGHAETNLVRTASGRYYPAELATCTLYTSTEPCAMCSGAIYWSGIGRVVFALSESELLELTGDNPENPTLSLPSREVFARGQREITVVGPVPLPEAQAVHAGFWS